MPSGAVAATAVRARPDRAGKPSRAVAAIVVRPRPDRAGKPSRAVAAIAVRPRPDRAGERVLPSGSIGGKDWQPTALAAGTWGVPPRNRCRLGPP
jgi:hypothetical protein